MGYLKSIDINEVLINLPTIRELNVKEDGNTEDDLFLCALGFEQRCLYIPEVLSSSGYKTKSALYIEYETNIEDNESNSSSLISALEKISLSIESPLQLGNSDFVAQFNRYISALSEGRTSPIRISIDISVFSSHCLLMVLSIIFNYNISLRIFYSEADTYYPTKDEYDTKRKLISATENEDVGISRGVLKVMTLPTHTGDNLDNLPEMLIAFATFKSERTRKVISDIALSEKDVFWIIGVPHLKDNYWRADALVEINNLSEEMLERSLRISTFEYKETIMQVESLYKQFENTHHITVSAMGSKLQNLGLALWTFIRKDVTLSLTIPASYDSKRFSSGIYKAWIVDFGHIQNVLDNLSELDNIIKVP